MAILGHLFNFFRNLCASLSVYVRSLDAAMGRGQDFWSRRILTAQAQFAYSRASSMPFLRQLQ